MKESMIYVSGLGCNAVVKFAVMLDHEYDLDRLKDSLKQRLHDSKTAFTAFDLEYDERRRCVFTLPYHEYEARKKLLVAALEQIEIEVTAALMVKELLGLLE
jgi:hypothetical protein